MIIDGAYLSVRDVTTRKSMTGINLAQALCYWAHALLEIGKDKWYSQNLNLDWEAIVLPDEPV